MISRVRSMVTKTGRGAGSKMAMITLEDLNGSVDGVIFPDCLAQYGDLVAMDQMVFLRGSVDTRREDPSIRVNKIYDLSRAAEELTNAVYVRLGDSHVDTAVLEEFKTVCVRHPGKCPVYVEVPTGASMQVVLQTDRSVRPEPEFCRQLTTLFDAKHTAAHLPHARTGQARHRGAIKALRPEN